MALAIDRDLKSRSREVTVGPDKATARSMLLATGLTHDDLAKPLLGQGVLARLRCDAEIAGEGNLEAHPEAVAAVGRDHRLRESKPCRPHRAVSIRADPIAGGGARLLEIGAWLKTNGEAIFGTRPWIRFGEGPTHPKSGGFSESKKFSYTADDFRFGARIEQDKDLGVPGNATFDLIEGIDAPDASTVVVRW